MSNKLVIFDLDGVLIDSRDIHYIALNDALRLIDDKLVIPTIDTYNDLVYNNYNVNQLKVFAKHYKLKIGGNKPQLLKRLYNFLFFSFYAIKLQRNLRLLNHIVVASRCAMNMKGTGSRTL